MAVAGNPLFWMVIGHFLADYPLQGDWLSKAKNPSLEIVPGEKIWPLALCGHALIHSGSVLFITGSPPLGFAEFAAHYLIDFWKCRGGLSYNGDQYLHLLCKVVWFVASTLMVNR